MIVAVVEAGYHTVTSTGYFTNSDTVLVSSESAYREVSIKYTARAADYCYAIPAEPNLTDWKALARWKVGFSGKKLSVRKRGREKIFGVKDSNINKRKRSLALSMKNASA